MTSKRFLLESSTRSRKPLYYLVSTLLIVAIGLVLRPLFSTGAADAESGPNVEALTPPEIILMQREDEAPVFSAQQNGITTNASNFRIEEGRYKADVCFDMPDASDWTIWEARLEYNNHREEYFGFYPIEIRLPSENGVQKITTFSVRGEVLAENYSSVDVGTEEVPGLRCDTVHFAIADGVAIDKATMIIESIAAYPSEGMECLPDYLNKVNAALKSINAELAADCFVVDLDGGGISGLQISAKPESMGQAQAEDILHSKEVFNMINAIVGPWQFSSTGE